MKIWLITIGEPLPIDGGCDRLLRTGILAGILAAGGSEVLWWTSSFDHVRKRQRCLADTVKEPADRYRIRLLHAPGYRKNISPARLANHAILARKFRKSAEDEGRPDIILCSLPIPELCVEAVRYGKKHGVPVVIDIRDLWPDLIRETAPSWGRWLMDLLLAPMTGNVWESCGKAIALFALTPEFLNWGLRFAGRDAGKWDRVFPMGYPGSSPSPREVEEATAHWISFGVRREDFNICFLGAIGHQSDFGTVIDAAKILSKDRRNIRFVICGDGDMLESFRRKGKECPNILFPGWVNRTDIWTLMRISSLGLVPFFNRTNYTRNIPNKPIEYLSAGLPILSGLSGVLAGLLAENECGVTYEEGKPELLAEAIRRLHDDREALHAMSRNAKSLYERSFVAERVYAEMAAQLSRIAEEHRPPMA